MNSNLSSYSIDKGNHMVTAIREDHINDSLKQYADAHRQEVTAYRLSCADGGNLVHFTLMRNTNIDTMPSCFPDSLKHEELFDELENEKAFDLMSDPDSNKRKIRKIYKNYGVTAACRYVVGLPDSYLGEGNSKRIFELEKGITPEACSAKYTQLFVDFMAFEINEMKGKIYFQVIQQGDVVEEECIKVVYQMPLTVKEVKLHDLPEELQNKIRERFTYDTDQAIDDIFSLRKLIMDMALLSSMGVVHIDGLKESTRNWVVDIIKQTSKQLLDNAGGLGCIATPKEKNQTNYLFRPTNFSYMVSENLIKDDHDGNKKEVVKTLDYVISTTKDTVKLEDFGWAWITNDKTQGVTAICRDIFFDKFNKDFMDIIFDNLNKGFIAVVNCPKDIVTNLEYGFKEVAGDMDPSKYRFELKNSGENGFYYECKEYISSSETDKIWFYVPPFFPGTAQEKLIYKVKARATPDVLEENGVSYPAIKYSTTISMDAYFYYNDGDSSGKIYDHTIDCTIGFAIGSRGELTIMKKVKDTSRDEKIDVSAWSAFCTACQIDDIIGDLDNAIRDVVSGFVNDFSTDFTNEYADVANWVILGGDTFSFSGECFSKYGDFSSVVIHSSVM